MSKGLFLVDTPAIPPTPNHHGPHNFLPLETPQATCKTFVSHCISASASASASSLYRPHHLISLLTAILYLLVLMFACTVFHLLNELDMSNIMKSFKIPAFEDLSEFLSHMSKKTGRLMKGGRVNELVTARQILKEW